MTYYQHVLQTTSSHPVTEKYPPYSGTYHTYTSPMTTSRTTKTSTLQCHLIQHTVHIFSLPILSLSTSNVGLWLHEDETDEKL